MRVVGHPNTNRTGMVTAEGVSGVVRWLASDDARDVTGHVVPADRGYGAAGYQVPIGLDYSSVTAPAASKL